MAKETTIKLSRAFKQFLQSNAQGKEDLEATIKRLISIPKPVYHAQEQYTNKGIEASIPQSNATTSSILVYRQEEVKVFTNLADFQLEVLRQKLAGARS